MNENDNRATVKRTAKLGETTENFLVFLQNNGTCPVEILAKQLFWGGIRSRIGVLVKQGRITRVKIVNEVENSKNNRFIVTAYKIVPGCQLTALKRLAIGSPAITYNEKRHIQRLPKMIEKAKKLLEENGFTVVPNA
jgi:hypothetical protein